MTVRPGAVLGVVEIVLGAATAARAPRVAAAPWWFVSRPAMVAVVALLGARQVAQGAVTVARPQREVLLVGAAVDVLHALSLVPVVVTHGPYRRPARTSAALALSAAALALVARARS